MKNYDDIDHEEDELTEDEKFKEAADLLFPNVESEEELEEELMSRFDKMYD